MKAFMRLSQCLQGTESNQVGANDRAHCELYNPSDSNVIVTLLGMWVCLSTKYAICGRSGDILSGATFPESRGLPVYAFPPEVPPAHPSEFYAHAHARCKVTPSNAYIEGGMILYWDSDTAADLSPMNDIVQRRPGTGLLVRNLQAGQPLSVSFLWKEGAII